jgi:hypothetical protein
MQGNATGRAVARWWLGLFVVGFVVYGLTANRGAQWQDSGYHILRVVNGEVVNPLGLALSHPLHHNLGRFAAYIGMFEPCLAVTLLSSLAAALAVANVFGCVTALTRCLPAGLFAALALGLAHTFWQLATLAETYTLTAALLAAECWCIAAFAQSRRGKWLALAWLFNGIGLANHVLALLTIPVLVGVTIVALRRDRANVRAAAAGAGLWLIGSLPYTVLVGWAAYQTGDLAGALRSALFGEGYTEAVLNVTPSARQLLVTVAFTLLNFPNLVLPLAAYGLFVARRSDVPMMARRALAAGLLIHMLFAFRYDIVDQHTFFLPSYLLLTVFAGVGFAGLLQCGTSPRRRLVTQLALVSLAWTPALYAVAPYVARTPVVARRLTALGWPEHRKPYRDDYVYALVPWSVLEDSAERMSRAAIEAAGPAGLIVCEGRMSEFAIRYRVMRGGFDGIAVAWAAEPAALEEATRAGRSVVLVPRLADAPSLSPPMGSWQRVGDVYVLDRRAATDGGADGE